MFKKIFNIEKKTAIEKFKDKEDLLITYKDLSEIPIGETKQMTETEGAIETIRINSNDENSLMFTVSMKKGELWEKHHHDCDELCVVYKGELEDLLTSSIATRAGYLRIKKGQTHKIIANRDTVFYVEFKKPKKYE